jgi:hypothetical protein
LAWIFIGIQDIIHDLFMTESENTEVRPAIRNSCNLKQRTTLSSRFNELPHLNGNLTMRSILISFAKWNCYGAESRGRWVVLPRGDCSAFCPPNTFFYLCFISVSVCTRPDVLQQTSPQPKFNETAGSEDLTVFCMVALYSVVEVCRRYRGTCYLRHQGGGQ